MCWQKEKTIISDLPERICIFPNCLYLEGIIITCSIEDHEEIGVAIINIPVAYLLIDIYEHINMLLKGSLEEMMSLIYKNMYSKCVVINIK